MCEGSRGQRFGAFTVRGSAGLRGELVMPCRCWSVCLGPRTGRGCWDEFLGSTGRARGGESVVEFCEGKCLFFMNWG